MLFSSSKSTNFNKKDKSEIDDINTIKSISTNISLNDHSIDENNEKLNFSELLNSKELLFLEKKYIYNLIIIYLNECETNKRIKIRNKIRMRNIDYLGKILKNKDCEIKTKITINQKIFSNFFISFNKNLWILLLKYKNEKVRINSKNMAYIYNILKILLNLIGYSYISGIINDDIFELIMKASLLFSLENIQENNNNNKISKFINMMFFKGCIDLIKIVFNKIYLIEKQYSQRKKEIIKNIFNFILNNIIGTHEKNNFNYSNAYFLSKNDYKSSLLINFAPIITKIKSKEVTNTFINLLVNIYAFHFGYDNCMKPNLRLFEPLFLSLNNKKINEISNELELSDFTLKYLNGLINKEKEISNKDTCFMKQGFYFGKNSGAIYGDLTHNLENDFIIIFSLRLESDELYELSIFELYHESKTQIRFYITKNISSKYELIVEDETNESTPRIYIQTKKTYVFLVQFISETFRRQKLVKISYVKDDLQEKYGKSKAQINSGAEIKIKNIKLDNLKICIGCKRNKIRDFNFKNNFYGYLGDFIILNAKHIKENNDSKLYNEILKLKSNYYEIIKILLDNTIQKDNMNNLEFNMNPENKAIIENLSKKNEFKQNHIINTIISPKFFKLVEYHDEIDYMNSINNYDYYSSKKETPLELKKKYINFKAKSNSNKKKSIFITSSLFNNEFHIFERKSSLIEFIKYDGMHYFSLLFEYYYQILCFLIENKEKIEESMMKSLFKELNIKIIDVLNFFNENIIRTYLYENFIVETEKFFYKIAEFILKFSDINDLDIKTFKSLSDILNNFEEILLERKCEQNVDRFLLLIRAKIVELLLNPRLYQEKNGPCLEALLYVFNNLLTFLKEGKIKFLNKILKTKNLEMLFSFIWLLDEPKKSDLFDILKNKYVSLLILFLQISSSQIFDQYKIQSTKTFSHFINLTDKPKKHQKESYSEYARNISEDNNENSIIQMFLEKSLEFRKNTNIFSNLALIIVKSNTINLLKEAKIIQVQKCFMEEIKDKELKDTENKKILYLSYLQILISYYFSEPNYNSENTKEKNFHKFICSLDLDMDLFYSLISVFRLTNNFGKSSNKEIRELTSFKDETLKKLEPYDIPKFPDLPILEIKISYLRDIEIHIIKSILLDILTLLDKFENKWSLISKEKRVQQFNTSNISVCFEENNGKEVYDILKKNIDIIFKNPQTLLYDTILSSESGICIKLFQIKWKYGYEKDVNYIKTVLKKYYKELIKEHFCPFIFKFLLNIPNEKIFQRDPSFDNKKINSIILDLKTEMIIYIISTLKEFNKELKTSTEKMPYYIYNLLNCLIIVNKELNYQRNELFYNQNLCNAVNILISLVAEGPLYTNFCIGVDSKTGKIISEIILDLYLAIPQDFFHRSAFINTFINYEKKMTIFYIIDCHKKRSNEIRYKKEKKDDKEKYIIPEIKKLEEFHKIINSINKIKNKKKEYLVSTNKIYSIVDVNFTIYFLAKCFVYLNSDIIKNDEIKEKKLKVKSLNALISCLSDDIYSLYTTKKELYASKTCGFPLYDETKKYFESYVIQNYFYKDAKNPNENLYKKFFENDMVINLKNEYDLNYCYSSKLNPRKKVHKENQVKSHHDSKNKKIKMYDFKSISSSEKDGENNKISENTSFIFVTDKIKSQNLNNSVELDLDNSEFNLTYEEIKEIPEIKKEFISSLELIKEDFTILNPRNFFFKIVYSNIFKNFIFKNKIFMDIKKIYLIKYRNYTSIQKESKQINYPTKQKNFSNFLEPRIFLKRDYNFGDKTFFPISYEYLPKCFFNKILEEMFLYKHKFKFKKEKSKMSFFCELVTNSDIYFGKMFFFEKYIIFETEEDPRNNPNINFETYLEYAISIKGKDAKSRKHKFIILYFNKFQEAIKRRTLLVTQSIEIFMKNGKSYFFNFFWTKYANKFYYILSKTKEEYDFIFEMNENKEIKYILNQFKNGKISNYLYLLYLNKYSTRTFSDLSQYPVFPWLILENDKIRYLNDYFDNKSNSKNILEIEPRNMKYPISMQSEENRIQIIHKYKQDAKSVNFPSHFNNHYSSSAFVFYYLMRLNPFCQNLIKLQNYQNENPNRMFISYEYIGNILLSGADNRELIPDFYCYFDFFLNLNCCYFGKIDNIINDDFFIKSEESSFIENYLPQFVYSLYQQKKLLNSNFVSKEIHKWVDIIFGKNQIPENEEDAANSCNIYHKLSYEQKINYEEKIKKYKNKHELGTMSESEIKEKLSFKMDLSGNFGMTPKQILKNTNVYEGENKISTFEAKKTFEDKLIYFEKISNDEYIFLKDLNKKDNNKIKHVGVYTLKNKSFSEVKIYECKQLNLLKKYKNITINYKNKEKKIPLYNPCYAFTYINLKTSKKNSKSKIAILTCRYLGNYFNVQTMEKNINVYCEDFVTCIKRKNKLDSENFYTGLLNGKLTEWEIDYNFNMKEIRHVYSHDSSITAIELYETHSIIITTSEDNSIQIRKEYDFELLTVIDLTYCFGNPIISETNNIFPSLIKISNLNLLYVLIFDKDKKRNFIRGYNLNGIFFAETQYKSFLDNEKNNLIINSISFTKNSNLIIGFYNINQYYALQSWDLKPYSMLKNFNIPDKKERVGTEMISYDHKSNTFSILYENEVFIIPPKEDDNLEKF